MTLFVCVPVLMHVHVYEYCYMQILKICLRLPCILPTVATRSEISYYCWEVNIYAILKIRLTLNLNKHPPTNTMMESFFYTLLLE